MFKLNKFVPVVKVDVAKRLVYGVLAEEAVDKSSEIMDYASSKPYFKAWNEQFEKSTSVLNPDGTPMSVGNLRSMHTKIAAGKFVEMTYDDDAKKIYVVAKVTDNNEWPKVLEGVYTGFSVGGKYVKVWQDGELLRYTAAPSEGSLVDNPCMYGATFTAIKGEGLEEMIKFTGSGMQKSMYEVQDLAGVIASLNCVRRWLRDEAIYEGDNSQIPGKLKTKVDELAQILVELVQEEASELTSGEDEEDVYKMFKPEEFAKMLEEALTKAVAPLAASVEELKKTTATPTLAKVTDANTDLTKFVELTKFDGLEKIVNEKIAGFEKAVGEFKTGMETIVKTVQELAEGFEKYLSEPVPSKAVVNGAAVTKDADAGQQPAIAKDAKPEDVIKGIHSAGPVVVK